MNGIETTMNVICGVCNRRFYPDTDTARIGTAKWQSVVTEVHVHRKECLHLWRFANETA